MQAMEKRLGMLGEPYHQEEAGKYAKLAKACSLGGAALIGTTDCTAFTGTQGKLTR